MDKENGDKKAVEVMMYVEHDVDERWRWNCIAGGGIEWWLQIEKREKKEGEIMTVEVGLPIFPSIRIFFFLLGKGLRCTMGIKSKIGT